MTAELENIIQTLKSNKTYLHDKYGVSEIGIFGSYTRNDYTSESDVDLLVDFDRTIGWNIVSLADELEKLIHKKVDLSSKGWIKPNYWKYIQKDIMYV